MVSKLCANAISVLQGGLFCFIVQEMYVHTELHTTYVHSLMCASL